MTGHAVSHADRLALLLLGLLGACAAGRAPSALSAEWHAGAHCLEGAHGAVYYRAPELAPSAARVGAALDRLLPEVAATLGVERPGSPVVHLDPNWRNQANTFDNVILFNPSDGMIEYVDLVIAHELVHWTTWDTALDRNMPHTIWEGLCDVVAVQLAPQFADQRSSEFRERLEDVDLQKLLGRLDLGIREWLALPVDEQDELYALGFALVERIGVARLCAAAEAGVLSPKEVLELAGVASDERSWARAFGDSRPVALRFLLPSASPEAPPVTLFEGHASGQVPPGATSLEVLPAGPERSP